MKKKIRWILLAGITLLSLVLAASFFLKTKTVKEGDTVKVNYMLMLDDGMIYYTTAGNAPLRVKLGQGILLSSFEEALIGMRVGETKIVSIPTEQAYGPYRPDLVQVIEREQLPADVQPVIGQQFDAELMDGSPTFAVITDVTDKTVTLDANHPLAGENLNFEVNLISIEGGGVPVESTKMLIGGTLLAAGLGVVGFAFLSSRNRRRSAVVRWPGLLRRVASAAYRKR